MPTCCLLILVAMPLCQATVVPPIAAIPQTTAEVARIYRVLDEETAFEFIDKPLMEGVTELARQHGINVVFDSESLRRADVDMSTPVNLILNGVKLRSAFKILFDDLGLDYTVRDEVLMVLSTADVKASTTLHSYNVTALLTDADIDALVAAVRKQIPNSPEQTVRISGYRNLLLVTGNRHVQERVQQTLRVLTQGLDERAVSHRKQLAPRPTY